MTDTKKMGLHEAFCAAQSEIEGARKKSDNPFFSSKYADLKECFNACSGALNKHGINISQPTMLEGELFVIRTILTHNSGESIQDFGVPIIGWQNAKNPAQAFGSGQTYARRYGLCGMVGIAPEDDDGQSLTQDKPKAATQIITENQAKEIAFLIDSKGVDQEVFMKYYKVSTLSELPASKFASAIESLNKKDDV